MEALFGALQDTFTLVNLIAVISGVAIGMAFGLTPGLDATSGTALLVSFTYAMSPQAALLFLVSLYCAATYAGSITAILIGVPGTPASAATVLDGYPLCQRGEAGKALAMSISASVIGGIVGTIFLVTLSGPLVKIAIVFGAPEYFALGIFGLTMVASLSGANLIKNLIICFLGLGITTIGVDSFTAFGRFTFGVPAFLSGINYIPCLVGMFAISEAMMMVENLNIEAFKNKISARIITFQEFKKSAPVIGLSSIIGTIIGILPGVGAALANWICYDNSKKISKEADQFGKGALDGIAAAEAGNNATVSSSLIPMLTLGVPGSATAAILMSALILHGLTPGPTLFSGANVELVYVVFVGLVLANIVMGVLGISLVGFWAKVLRTPRPYIVVVITALSFIGAYGIKNSLTDCWVLLGFGVFAYITRKLGFSPVPMVLALVLGSMIETNFRRTMIMSNMGAMIFFTRPICLVLIVLSVVSFLWPTVIAKLRGNKDVLGD